RSNGELCRPDLVLDDLHAVSSSACQLSVLGALLMPLRWGDLSALELGKTVFLHRSAPDGWWDEWLALSRQTPGPGSALLRTAIAPCTMSEMMRLLEPLGVERWPMELALKHGIRDQLICPVGGRWVVVYSSRRDLSDRLAPEVRALLFLGATFAAI